MKISKTKAGTVLLIVIVIEIVIIFLQAWHLKNQEKKILGHNTLLVDKGWGMITERTDEYKFFYEPIPNSTIRHTAFGEKEYSINSDSLNSLREYSDFKELSTFRIIALGDSFTYGKHVNTKDNWPSLLENDLNEINCQRYKAFEVINLGVEGYDVRYAVERYQKRGIKYSPDLVLWLHVDFYRYYEEMHPLINKYYMNGETRNDSWSKAYADVVNKYGKKDLSENQTNTIKSLDNYFHGRLGFIINSRFGEKERSVLNEIIKNRGNGFVISLPNLAKVGAQFPDDSHPNEKGHKIISEIVRTYLINEKIIDCQLK